MITSLFLIFVFSVASFANNVITAASPGSRFDWARSRCPICGSIIPVYHLIPVVSYLILGGKCSECENKIQSRYFWVEICLISTGIFITFHPGPVIPRIISFLTASGLIIVIFTDALFYIIPNLALIFLAVIGFLKHWLTGSFDYRLLGFAAVTWSIFLAVKYLGEKILGKTVIGSGDIKFISLLVFLYGLIPAAFGLWLSALIAILIYPSMKRFIEKFKTEIRIPFGLFLSLVFLPIEIFDLKAVIENIIYTYAGL